MRVNAAGSERFDGRIIDNLEGHDEGGSAAGLYDWTTIYNPSSLLRFERFTFNMSCPYISVYVLNATVSYTATNANLILTRTPFGRCRETRKRAAP